MKFDVWLENARLTRSGWNEMLLGAAARLGGGARSALVLALATLALVPVGALAHTPVDENGNSVTHPDPSFGSATIADRTYWIGSDVFTPPFPTPTDREFHSYTYELAPTAAPTANLPTGLTFEPLGPFVYGIPTEVQTHPTASTEFTYTVEDVSDSSRTASLTFEIEVVANPVGNGSLEATPGDGRIVAAWTPPEVAKSGCASTDLALEYRVSRTGSAWVNGEGSRINNLSVPRYVIEELINGTSYDVRFSEHYRCEATGESFLVTSGSKAAIPAAGSQDSVPTFGTKTISDQTFTPGTLISPVVTLPEATGGDGSLSYTLTPDLPGGLSFDKDTRQITGTPTSGIKVGRATFTYAATDSDPVNPDRATLAFDIQVGTVDSIPIPGFPDLPDLSAPIFSLPDDSDTIRSPGALVYTLGLSPDTTRIPLPTALGGDTRESADEANQLPAYPYLVYSVAPELPDGLALEQDFGFPSILGAPDAPVDGVPALGRTRYSLVATDKDGDTGVWPFDIELLTVVPAFDDRGGFNLDYVLRQHAPVFEVLPRAFGGVGPLSYSLDPEGLPAGLTFDPKTRLLSGSPTVAQAAVTYTYTVTDSGALAGQRNSASITLTIAVMEAPSFGGQTLADREYPVGDLITPDVLPEATGGEGSLTYSLLRSAADLRDPDGNLGVTLTVLHPGLSFVPATRTIEGIAEAVKGYYIFDYIVEDDNGIGDVIPVKIAVQQDYNTFFGPGDRNKQIDFSFSLGNEVSTAALPAAHSGNNPFSYSITPALGSGLQFDPKTRMIKGTPLAAHLKRTYTYTATDADRDTDELEITIEVAADDVLSFPAGVGDPITLEFEAGEDVSETLPAAMGGYTPIMYSITPALDNGLAFDPATRTVSGSPIAAAASEHTYSATDADGSKAELTLAIKVSASAKQRRAMQHALAATAGALVKGAKSNIGSRFSAAAGRSRLSLAGRDATPVAGLSGAGNDAQAPWEPRWTRAGEERSGQPSRDMTADDLFRNSGFTLSMTDDEARMSGPSWTIWGQGSLESFRGRPEQGVRYDGDVRSGYLGVDAQFGADLLAGVAVSRSRGDTSYVVDEYAGSLDTSITAVHPYLRYRTDAAGDVWAILGIGGGEVENRPRDGVAEKNDLDMWMLAAGLRRDMQSMEMVDLSFTGGAEFAELETDGDPRSAIGALTAKSWQVDAGVEAALRAVTPGGPRPFGTAHLRQDGGDGVTGTGIEVGVGLEVAEPGSRFDLRVEGRWLAVHTESGYRDWGVSLAAALRPGAGGHGLSMSLSPRYGSETRNGAAVLRQDDALFAATAPADSSLALDTRVGYGLGLVPDAYGVLTPFAELSLSGERGRDEMRAGIEFDAWNGALGMELVGRHRETHASDSEKRLDLELKLRF